MPDESVGRRLRCYALRTGRRVDILVEAFSFDHVVIRESKLARDTRLRGRKGNAIRHVARRLPEHPVELELEELHSLDDIGKPSGRSIG